MPLPITIPNSFANATSSIPLSELDANFSTVAIAVNSIGNGAYSLANVTITGGSIANVSLDNVSVDIETLSNVTITNLTVNNTASFINAAVSANVITVTTTNITNANISNSAVISVNTSADALRITQTGAGNALVVEDSVNPDSTPFIITNNGTLLLGSDSAPSNFASAGFNLIGRDVGLEASISRITNDVNPARLFFQKSRGTFSLKTIVQSDDLIGTQIFYGYDGTNVVPAVSITAVVDGTPGTNDMPGRLVFSTTADGASTPTERLRITSTGALAIAGAANYGTAGQALVSAGNAAPVWTDQFVSITYVFSNIGAGDQGDLTIPFNCTITEWTLLADASGSVVIDIWKDTYANYPPTVADTITGSAKPTISASTKGQSSTLTGWTTTIAAGDTLRFNVDSASTVSRVTLSLKVKRT